jgi:hypothetical protein
MRELPLEEWRTPWANFGGRPRRIGACGLDGRKNKGGGGRREATTLFPGSRSHVGGFDVAAVHVAIPRWALRSHHPL